MTIVSIWERFLDSLDTSGGHIIVAIGLLGIGIAIGSMEVEMLAVGVLARGLGSTSRHNGKEPSA
jgi:hypothetical protein